MTSDITHLSFMQSDEKTVLCSAEDGWQEMPA